MSTHQAQDDGTDITIVSNHPAGASQVRLSLRLRDFELPSIRDAVVIGRRAPLGPRGLFESLDRMVPDGYELCPVEGHSVVEAAIIRKGCYRLLDRDRLLALLIRNAEPLMRDSSIIQVELDGEVSVQVGFTT